MSQDIEKLIETKGLTAPRITPDHIEGLITSEQHHVFPGTTFMICLLTLKNGFNVHGVSACASPENFDEEVGKAIARENAVHEIRKVEGYRLKEDLHRASDEVNRFAKQVVSSE